MRKVLQREKDISLCDGLNVIYDRMSYRLRRRFLAVVLLMFVGAASELATIGAVLPFLALLTDRGRLEPQRWLSWMPTASSNGDPALLATALFMLLAVMAGFVRLALARSSRSFVFGLGHELAVEVQRRILLQPFSFHSNRNSSTLLSAVNKTETLVLDVLLPLVQAVTGAVIAISITGILIAVAPVATLLIGTVLGLAYALVPITMRDRLARNSAVLESSYDARLRIAQESLGAIRDVILDHSQSTYLSEFADVDETLAEARATTQFISLAPRFVIEMVGVVIIAAMAMILADRSGGIGTALPILGALALGGQRLLPLVQEIYVGWSLVEGQRSIFDQIVGLLTLPLEEKQAGPTEEAPLPLRTSIRIESLGFTYLCRRSPALEDVTFEIPAGTSIALVGGSGSGKSTLADLLMGLLEPGRGRICIDDLELAKRNVRNWQRSIGHVPQSIFLADATIARNIILGCPDEKIDLDRVVRAAKQAQLHDFVETLPQGYDTIVGERGVRLSGGQRQRLGLARAIYKRAPVLVLDEATSALDYETEAAVIAALEELRREGRTIVIIAHRRSTTRHCDFVARLDHGRLVEFGPLTDGAVVKQQVS